MARWRQRFLGNQLHSTIKVNLQAPTIPSSQVIHHSEYSLLFATICLPSDTQGYYFHFTAKLRAFLAKVSSLGRWASKHLSQVQGFEPYRWDHKAETPCCSGHLLKFLDRQILFVKFWKQQCLLGRAWWLNMSMPPESIIQYPAHSNAILNYANIIIVAAVPTS